MKRFIEGQCRTQVVLFPARLDDWIGEDNPVRAIDVFVDELEFQALGFEAPSLPLQDDLRTTQPRFSRSTSTAISTVSSRVGALNVKRSATLS